MTEKTKWTPGPWRKHGLSVEIAGKEDAKVCLVVPAFSHGGDMSEDDANAQLIALAPEMAEFLRRLFEGGMLDIATDFEISSLIERLPK